MQPVGSARQKTCYKLQVRENMLQAASAGNLLLAASVGKHANGCKYAKINMIPTASMGKHATCFKRGKTCHQLQARKKTCNRLQARKKNVTSFKRGKKCNMLQERENMQPGNADKYLSCSKHEMKTFSV